MFWHLHRKMVSEGADMIDIGARSTSPSANPVSPEIEAERMDLALRELEGSGITLSVDTTRPDVLKRCLRYDIHAVNDIGGSCRQGVWRNCRRFRPPCIPHGFMSGSGRSDRHANQH